MFSKEQIEEIDVLQDLCDGLQVNGEPFICFDILSDIVHSNKGFSKLSQEELLLLKKQLFEYKKFWQDIDWFDNRIFLELLPQFETRIEIELLKY
ncbi:hypothetical protein [Paenibacillus campi]|uniref:hypothetical protein n=1 Tax=Paenibacillus campi TaxID=3106031 RepID=UPI002AFF7B8B|nr:hypothetical protein [Paenibacillus sp. SGZ-1014]